MEVPEEVVERQLARAGYRKNKIERGGGGGGGKVGKDLPWDIKAGPRGEGAGLYPQCIQIVG